MISISTASEATWGKAQTTLYIDAIRKRLDQLCDRPELGPPLGRRRPGLRRLRVGRHIIFYRFDDDRVQVLRILHEAMDIEHQLGAP